MFVKILTILTGIGLIVFAAMCFKDVPLIGTVFLMPGDNILEAQMTDPFVRYALFLIGGLFTAYGFHLQIRIGFANPMKESGDDDVPRKSGHPRRKPWGQA